MGAATAATAATAESATTAAAATERCPCGNAIESEGLTLCDYCDFAASQPLHTFRRTLFGELWCITCTSNYCELA